MPPVFEWDRDKARRNLRKHGVSFVEAVSVFADPLARVFPDEDHSADERREIIIRPSLRNRLLVISFTEQADERVRIISARRATKREQRDYAENATN